MPGLPLYALLTCLEFLECPFKMWLLLSLRCHPATPVLTHRTPATLDGFNSRSVLFITYSKPLEAVPSVWNPLTDKCGSSIYPTLPSWADSHCSLISTEMPLSPGRQAPDLFPPCSLPVCLPLAQHTIVPRWTINS